MKRTITMAIAALLITFTAVSCNLDGGKGVYQAVFDAPPPSTDRIHAVLGKASGDAVLYCNQDIYVLGKTSPTAGNPNPVDSLQKIAEITFSSYMPFYCDGSNVYFAYRNPENGYFEFYYVSLYDLKKDNGITDTNRNRVSASFDGGSGNIVNFEAYNYFQNKLQVLYAFDSDNAGAAPNERIKHYGIMKVNVNSLTVTGGVVVPSTATVFGNGAIRAFANDSDIDGLANGNFFIYTKDGTYQDKNIQNNVYEDDIPMGFDGEYVIFLDGDIAQLMDKNNSFNNWRGFVNDLVYRSDDIMIPYTVSDFGDGNTTIIGYLYGEGIYLRTPNGTNKNPQLLGLSSDTDIMTAGFIGHRIEGSTLKVLMATKENGFWILQIDYNAENKSYSGSSHIYNPAATADGPVSEYEYI